MKQDKFELDFLDHVAIRVRDLNASANWYTDVLGLTKYQLPEWGDFPIFMLAGKTGIALFPANLEHLPLDQKSHHVKIDHFAFRLSRENFEKAQTRYRERNLNFTFQDHHYYHSIYTKDPDGHTVELTTLVVDENKFFRK